MFDDCLKQWKMTLTDATECENDELLGPEVSESYSNVLITFGNDYL